MWFAATKLYLVVGPVSEQSRQLFYAMRAESNHSSGNVLGFHVQNMAQMKASGVHARTPAGRPRRFVPFVVE